jgi:ribonuclease-3 family protein
VARRGDYPTDRLDTIKAAVVRADAQAALLDEVEARLTEDEVAVVRRGRNASLPSSARGRGNTAAYRSSTALEALVAHWTLAAEHARFDAILGGPLERAIDEAVARHAKRVERG